MAALPADHPHAIAIPSPRKPKVNLSIVKSPSMADKLRQQFTKKRSLKSLKTSITYDADARSLSMTPEDDESVSKKSSLSIKDDEPVERAIQAALVKAASSPDLLSRHPAPEPQRVNTFPMLSRLAPLLRLRELDPGGTDCGSQTLEEPCLAQMQISKQLRSPSQMTEACCEEEDHSMNECHACRPHEVVPFESKDQIGENTATTEHAQQLSSLGFTAGQRASTRTSTRPRQHDARSSVYSQPSVLGIDGRAMSPDDGFWPLTAEQDKAPPMAMPENASVVLPNARSSYKNQEPPSLLAVSEHSESARSDQAWSSSSVRIKKTRFVERFTPPKKTVKKRRSVFNFLRPNNSILRPRRVHTMPALTNYDGPLDDNGLLPVQYELSGPSSRSTSRPNMTPRHAPDRARTSDPSTADTVNEGRHSQYSYERKLSVIGDDRRKPSVVDLRRLQEIEDEDRRESLGVRRELSRARPLKDDTNNLMAKALDNHQREKALFRSISKRRELQEGHDSCDSSLALSVHDTCPQQSVSETLSQLDQWTDLHSAASRLPEDVQVPDAMHPRIGTSLESWTRFSSHDRGERCGVAGAEDAVMARDFARQQSEGPGLDAAPPTPSNTISSIRSKLSLSRSASNTFGSIKRYYANLFTSRDFSGQGRRTSVNAGGKLVHPELELLPPVLPTSSPRHHGPLHSRHVTQTKERVHEAAGKVLRHHRVNERDSPFRGDSPFEQADTDSSESRRRSTITGPLDGSGDVQLLSKSSSKAEIWSNFYQQCVIEGNPPTSLETQPKSREGSAQECGEHTVSQLQLRPAKTRGSPLHEKVSLDPYATIKRFPSVTVVDDRKGHSRSISFLSTVSGKSLMRSSTKDLLALVQAREQQEREKLLNTVGTADEEH